jgi:TrmH family RNA methyltransferase
LARRRTARDEQQAFVLDSPILIADALDSGVELEVVYLEADAHDDLAARAAARGVPVHVVPPGAVGKWKATDLVTPQGAVAIAHMPAADIGSVVDHDLVLVLVDVADPGNAGTLVRSAEAAGAGAVVFCAGTVDPYNPKCVRASAGSVLHLDMVRAGAAAATLDALGAGGHRRVAAVARAGRAPAACDLSGPTAIVVGGEAHGLTDDVVARCDELVTIPMHGRVESLNAAMAGTILLFEADRQRRGGGDA